MHDNQYTYVDLDVKSLSHITTSFSLCANKLIKMILELNTYRVDNGHVSLNNGHEIGTY